MPISYRIDESLGLLIVKGIGSITDDDVAGHKDALVGDPNLRFVQRELSDFTEATFAISSKRIPAVARLHQEVFAGVSCIKRAVLVSSDLQYGLVRMYAQCLAPSGHEVAPFREVAEARKWLGLPESDEDT